MHWNICLVYVLAHDLAQFFPVILASHCAKIFAFQSLFTVWKLCLELITVTKVSDKLSLSSCLIRFTVIVNSCIDIADRVFSRGCKNGANTFSLILPFLLTILARISFSHTSRFTTTVWFFWAFVESQILRTNHIDICCAQSCSEDEKCFRDPVTFLLRDHHTDPFHRLIRCLSTFSAHIGAPIRNWFLVNPHHK